MKIRAPLLDGPSYGPLSPHGGSHMKSGFVEFWSPGIMGHDRYVLFFLSLRIALILSLPWSGEVTITMYSNANIRIHWTAH